MEKNGRARRARDNNIMWSMRSACWITLATDAHSEYKILIAFPRQQRLHKSASMLRLYIHCQSFYISLTVHLDIIVVNNQPDALFSMYLFPFSTCFEQPSAHHQENRIVSIHHLVYVTLCRWLPNMRVRHTRQSPTESDIHQMMYWYNSILLMMGTGLLETC